MLKDNLSIQTKFLNKMLIATIFIFFFAGILLLTFQQTFAAEPRIVKVGSDDHFPVIFQDKGGVAQGLYVDILTEIGRQENIRFEYDFGTWADSLNLIKSGKIDLLPGVAYTNERLQFMDYSNNPILTVWGELYALKSSEIKSIFDVSGKRIGVIKTDINAKNFLELTSQFHINCELVELAGYEDVFKAIKSKTVDAGVVGISYGASKQGEYGLRSTGVVFNPYDLYIATTKGKNQDLILIIDKYLGEWKNQDVSVLSTARQKWIYGSVGTVAVVPDWMINVFVFLAIMIAIAMIFIIILKLQVQKVTKTLRESELKQAKMIANIGDVIVIIDQNGINRYKSPNIEKWFGWKPEDLVEASIWDNVHPEDMATAQQFINDLMDRPNVTRTTECRYRCKDGSYKWIEFTGINLLYDPDIRGILGNYQDITDRKQAEVSLIKSESQFRNLFNSITDLIYTQDMEGRFISTNSAMLRLFGYDMDEFIGNSAADFMEPELQSGFNSRYLEVIKKQGHHEGVACYFKKNKEKIYIEYKSFLVKPDDDEFYISGFGRDVTEKVLSEKKIEQLQKQVAQAQKMESIGTLAGGIAHDFNNILYPIVGHTEMLMEDFPDAGSTRDSLNAIYTGSLRAKDLVQQILAFARQEKTELKLMKMQPIIKEAMKLIRSTIPATISIRQDLKPDCGPVSADPTQIHQIVMNLATNAYHAMEENGGELKVNLKEIELGEDDLIDPDMSPGLYACLTIGDTGVGMSKDVMNRIFDPFFTTKEKGKGTGMGLSVVHGIVKRMSGEIQVYSEPGKGTEFQVYLPVVGNVSEKQEPEADEPLPGGSERLLLVDDETVIIAMEKQALERLGYQVTSRISSIEALEAFRANPEKFDLVITDMSMPNMSGDKLASELIKIRPDIPILLCTGFSETMTDEKIKSLGLRGILMKPMMMKDLARKIREVLDK